MSLINKAEIRRLEKAARDKNKAKLQEWAIGLENQLIQDLKKSNEQQYELDVKDAWNNLFIALGYTLFCSEETKFNKKDINPFLNDLCATLDLYRTGEYKPEEFIEILKDNGVVLEEYDYSKIYKDYVGTIDMDLVKLIKEKQQQIITILGAPKYKSEILELYKELTISGNIVLIDGIAINQTPILVDEVDVDRIMTSNEDKILLSNIVYIVNPENKVDETTKQYIKYAQQHKKEIRYTYKED